MNSFNLDHLTCAEFEELCYDLLTLEGFVNLIWRKGTSSDSVTTADQGCDIEGQRVYEIIGGKCILETWFFECKHHKKAIPPSKIEEALSWAQAKSPKFLVLIASNCFTNPAKEYLDRYEKNRKPPFSIITWEKKDLERILIRHPRLMERYRINSGTINIALPFEINGWKDESLARVLRYMLGASEYADIKIRSSLENGTRIYSINLTVEHAEQLYKLFMEESKKEHTGIQLVLDPSVLDIELRKETPIPFAFDFKNIDFEKTPIEGFLPVILNIVPLNPLEFFNTCNKKDES